jgi:hypothetical protein
VVDEAVVLGLVRREPAVPVGVLLDLLGGLPVWKEIRSAICFFTYSICSAWMAMSAAVPPMPPDGWCIMIRACGVA